MAFVCIEELLLELPKQTTCISGVKLYIYINALDRRSTYYTNFEKKYESMLELSTKQFHFLLIILTLFDAVFIHILPFIFFD